MWRFKREIAAVLIVSAVLVGCGEVVTESKVTPSTTTKSTPKKSSTTSRTKSRLVDTVESDDNSRKIAVLDNSNALKGYYLDSEVKGVTYRCGEYEGKTDSNGLFLFEEGEGCSFQLGDVEIKNIEPDELFNGVSIIEDDVEVARVLQTMDIDNNPENGIDIEPKAIECLDVELPKSQEALESLVSCLNKSEIPDFVYRERAVSLDEAERHLASTRASLIPQARDLNITLTMNNKADINILAENPRDDMLTYEIIDEPTNGRLEGKAPNFIYIPNDGFTGSDSFSYRASNRRFSSEIATVSINVKQKITVSSERAKVAVERVNVFRGSSEKITINSSDNVVIYQSQLVDSSKNLTKERVATITRELYSKFRDDFDFIFIVSDDKNRSDFSYSGLYFGVQNDTEGLGKGIFDYSAGYGSDGRLQGVIHFPSVDKFDKGPKLHELLHRWANSIIDFKIKGKVSHHWGLNGFDKRGQLGGFETSTLRVEDGSLENGGLFSAERFGTNANGGDGLPYNRVEQYLMGLIPADEVGDILLTEGATYVKSEDGRTYFRASKVEKIAFTEYLKREAIKPRAEMKRDSFRVLTVLLTNSTPSSETVERVESVISNFARFGSDDFDYSYNLYEATNGKLHLDIDGLSDSFR